MIDWTHIEGCDACHAHRCAFCVTEDGTTLRLCTEDPLREMVDAYIEAALWSSTETTEDGDMGDPLDENYGPDDLSDETFIAVVRDCDAFLTSEADKLEGLEPSMIGHNFWLSRNGHGAGFFDSDAEHADALQRATKPYGSVDLYVGDDHRIHGA